MPGLRAEDGMRFANPQWKMPRMAGHFFFCFSFSLQRTRCKRRKAEKPSGLA